MFIRPAFWRNDRPSRLQARGYTHSLPLRRFKVLLHRTDQNLVSVARAVMEVTRFGSAEAEYRMWEAHHRGSSLVLVTHLEKAELVVEQFALRGLPASIEPA